MAEINPLGFLGKPVTHRTLADALAAALSH
jgi:hypothetical protein